MVHSTFSPIKLAKNMTVDGAKGKKGDHLSTDSDILYR